MFEGDVCDRFPEPLWEAYDEEDQPEEDDYDGPDRSNEDGEND
jgi:hypothetical protein